MLAMTIITPTSNIKNSDNGDNVCDALQYLDLPMNMESTSFKFPPGCRVVHTIHDDTNKVIKSSFATIDAVAINIGTRQNAYKFHSPLSQNSSLYHDDESKLSFAPETSIWLVFGYDDPKLIPAVILSALPTMKKKTIYSVISLQNHSIYYDVDEEFMRYRNTSNDDCTRASTPVFTTTRGYFPTSITPTNTIPPSPSSIVIEKATPDEVISKQTNPDEVISKQATPDENISKQATPDEVTSKQEQDQFEEEKEGKKKNLWLTTITEKTNNEQQQQQQQHHHEQQQSSIKTEEGGIEEDDDTKVQLKKQKPQQLLTTSDDDDNNREKNDIDNDSDSFSDENDKNKSCSFSEKKIIDDHNKNDKSNSTTQHSLLHYINCISKNTNCLSNEAIVSHQNNDSNNDIVKNQTDFYIPRKKRSYPHHLESAEIHNHKRRMTYYNNDNHHDQSNLIKNKDNCNMLKNSEPNNTVTKFIVIPTWTNLRAIKSEVLQQREYLNEKYQCSKISLSRSLMSIGNNNYTNDQQLWAENRRPQLEIVGSKIDSVNALILELYQIIAERGSILCPQDTYLVMYDLAFENILDNKENIQIQDNFAHILAPPQYDKKMWIGIVIIPIHKFSSVYHWLLDSNGRVIRSFYMEHQDGKAMVMKDSTRPHIVIQSFELLTTQTIHSNVMKALYDFLLQCTTNHG